MDATASNLSRKPDHVSQVIPTDLRFFVNLTTLDLSDNKLGYKNVLEHLLAAQRLTSLSLACNDLSVLSVRRGKLPGLNALKGLAHLGETLLAAFWFCA